ncbi:MAG: hypothetical protein ACKVJK_24060 [Methylophagaceae bacterium]|jgi:hypothetical protein|tara:strand:- start:126 stop:308 length:183 start_codon:yes stop_codon:yes gene_type:complete
MKNRQTIEDIDKFLISELCSDMSKGNFYTDVDDDTLSIALESIYADKYLWMDRGIVIGES